MGNVILIGMMGAGKSSVGKIIAKKLRWKFVDSDEVIAKNQNMSIPEIFKKKGEKTFRKVERSVIQKLCQKKKIVIAVGGGAPCFRKNWNSFRKNGFVIYLSARAKTLFQRLKKDTATRERPLLNGKATLSRIQVLLKKRKRFYQKADCIVHTDSLSMQEVANRIAKIFNEKNPS